MRHVKLLIICAAALGGVVFLNNRKNKSKSPYDPLIDPNKNSCIQHVAPNSYKKIDDTGSKSDEIQPEDSNIWGKFKEIGKEIKEIGNNFFKKPFDKSSNRSTEADESKNATERNAEEHNNRCVPQPKSQPEIRSADEELKRNSFLGGIISQTFSVLNGRTNEDITYVSLYRNWDTALNIASSKLLTDEYNKIIEDVGVVSEYIGDSTAKQVIDKWINYITGIGIQRYKEKNINENGNIIITEENRSYYKNGVKFPDGTECRIIEIPLTLKGEVYYAGELEAVNNTFADQAEGETEAKPEIPAEPVAETEAKPEAPAEPVAETEAKPEAPAEQPVTAEPIAETQENNNNE